MRVALDWRSSVSSSDHFQNHLGLHGSPWPQVNAHLIQFSPSLIASSLIKCLHLENVRPVIYFRFEGNGCWYLKEANETSELVGSANAKECSNYRTIALLSRVSKVMLKILQARLQQYMNYELPDVQAGFRKGRGTRDQIANKDHGIQSHHFMANRWGNNGNSERLFWGAPKSPQMVTTAMKLKDAYSLEEKLWPT